MAWTRVWRRAARKAEEGAAFDREIAFHVAELMRENLANGMPEAEARRQALLAFGGREQTKQSLREVHSSALVESIGFHVKAASRFLRSAPSFSAAVIVTLALGIGANSAVFSAIDAVVLRPLPFPAGDQLVALAQQDIRNREANHLVAPVRLEDWNRLSSAFQGITGYYTDDLSESSGPMPEKLSLALVAPRFLQVLGIAPMLGRDFTRQEEHFGGPQAVLISHAFWQHRFNGDPAVLGKRLHGGSFSYAIVGVMPASFAFPSREVDVWAPSPPDAPYAQSRSSTWFSVIGRLRPGLTVAQGEADLATVQSQLGKQFPKPDADLKVNATPLKETVVGGVRPSLWLLYGSVSLLLLIACSNIAALLLARTTDREHELALRFALGASRRAVIGQLLAETFGLALLGSALGLLIAAGAAHGFHLLSATLPRAEEITLNWRVALYSLVSAVATTLLCGLLPALRGTRRELAGSLAQGGRTHASGRNPLQWLLVGVQVMLAVTLLTGAGLLLRSLQELNRVSPGFDASHVLTLEVSGSWGETANMGKLAQRIDRTLDGLRALPGVEAAAIAAELPGVPALYTSEYKIDGKVNTARRVMADARIVSAGYFATMHIALLQGEGYRQGATTNDVLVNRSFANTYFGDSPVLGHVLAQQASAFPMQGQIRGVVGDAREQGLNVPPMPTVYSCFSAPNASPHYLVRTKGDPMAMAEAVRRRVHALEPSRSVFAMMPLQEHLDGAFAEGRLRTLLLAGFAGTAVLLACLGLYGTLSYLARMRQREVGLRLALGALRSRIVAGFVWQGLRVTALGCIAGLLLSAAAGHWMASLLFGISALDAETYGGVVVAILGVATVASLAPSVRAARVEPVAVLRES